MRYTATVPGLPKVHETPHYRATGDGSFEVKSVQKEATFGKAIDGTRFPRTIERDLRRTLDNIEDIFWASRMRGSRPMCVLPYGIVAQQDLPPAINQFSARTGRVPIHDTRHISGRRLRPDHRSCLISMFGR